MASRNPKLIALGGAGGGGGSAASSIPAGLTSNWAIKTGNYTFTTSDYGIVVNAAGNTTQTLIAASGADGRVARYVNINTGIVTIDATGLGTIDGANTIKLRQYDAVDLIAKNSIWYIVGSYLPTQASLVIPAFDIDWSLASIFTKTLAANSTFTFSNTSETTIIVALTNTASNYTVTWPTVAWTAATPPTQTIGAKTDVYTFVKIGSIFYGSVVQNMS